MIKKLYFKFYKKTWAKKYGMDEVFKDVVICCAYALANNADFNEKKRKMNI
ncbi:MAG: hypothetical protein L6V91_10565 [Bacilli bacterium]|nr:MAG: hypothetical protein L6V91_10565 [Bacilli bacterium]